MKPKKFTQTTPAATCPPAPPPTTEQIAALAHAIWIDQGRPVGRDLDNWLEAERQLRGGMPLRTTTATGNITAPPQEVLDPDRADAGRIERALDRVAGPFNERSPTSL